MQPELEAMGRSTYVSLTTFRRSGVGVSTPVWIAPQGDALVVMTEATTGKAKRLRSDPRVELRVCTMRGEVDAGALVAHGRAEVIDDPGEVERLLAGHRRKYGWQFRGFRLLQRLGERRKPREHVVLRITDA